MALSAALGSRPYNWLPREGGGEETGLTSLSQPDGAKYMLNLTRQNLGPILARSEAWLACLGLVEGGKQWGIGNSLSFITHTQLVFIWELLAGSSRWFHLTLSTVSPEGKTLAWGEHWKLHWLEHWKLQCVHIIKQLISTKYSQDTHSMFFVRSKYDLSSTFVITEVYAI